ncbi:MAG: hypothetical protein E7670_06390 [Ruminococcaceae bacterium]|nr:hypothetical protein [Oscillospiraceae bacterium]
MATVINDGARYAPRERIPENVIRLLPYRLREELKRAEERISQNEAIEEVRVRCGKAASITVSGGNIMLDSVITRLEMDSIMQELCDGSLYAHSEEICKGYLTLENGVRVGVCGRAAVDGGKVIGIYSVSCLNFRIPARYERVGLAVSDIFSSVRSDGGVLVYSPPRIGKTTLLRNVARRLASGAKPLRTAVIDTRGEIAPFLDSQRLCIDILSGYPKPVGIEIAARTLSAEVIICDEIGDADEAKAIVAAQNNGVPFIATAHAGDIDSLLRRPQIRMLHEARVFCRYVGISRRGFGEDYRYAVNTWEEANDRIKNCGGVIAHV